MVISKLILLENNVLFIIVTTSGSKSVISLPWVLLFMCLPWGLAWGLSIMECIQAFIINGFKEKKVMTLAALLPASLFCNTKGQHKWWIVDVQEGGGSNCLYVYIVQLQFQLMLFTHHIKTTMTIIFISKIMMLKWSTYNTYQNSYGNRNILASFQPASFIFILFPYCSIGSYKVRTSNPRSSFIIYIVYRIVLSWHMQINIISY